MAQTPVEPASLSRLGGELRAAREARHLALHKVAQEMHVSDDIIQQLEQDNYAALGAPIFVRGHLRNYARLLGLPQDEVLAKYDQTSGRLAPPPLVTQRTDAMGRFGRRIGLPVFSIVVIAVLVVLAVVWWQHRTPSSGPPANLQSSAPASIASLPVTTSSAAFATARLKTSAGGELQAALPLKSSEAQASRSVVRTAVAALAQHVMQKPTGNAHAPESYSMTEQGVAPAMLVHAKFSVHQASWIEVYDAAGKRLYYNLAPAGDNLEINGAGPLQVFLGNAPGVSVEYNGAAFNPAPFIQPNNNTARFTLGSSTSSGKPTG